MPTHSADILLVTATKVESTAVLDVFRQATGEEANALERDGRLYWDLGEVSGARIFLTQSEMGAGGIGAAIQSVQKGIATLWPVAVIMVGIAFGIDHNKQSIGDILVSTQLSLYDLQRVGTKKGKVQITLRGDRPHASSSLVSRFRAADIIWSGANVRFGTVLSGEKLVDNLDFREQLRTFEAESIGGEMEGAGLYVACHDAKVDWILIKAICDWADGNKGRAKKARQQTAATNAARFVLHTLQFAQFQRTSMISEADVPQGSIQSSIPPQQFFFGREKELASIAEAILPESRTWGVLIDGPGGIGKTALAIRAGHLAPMGHYPRKIFLTAKLRELTPEGERSLQDFGISSYVALLTELAHEMGHKEVAKTPENERANAVRRILIGEQALLIIDNIETFPESERQRLYQFLSLLPTGCKAIVTSRRRSDVDVRTIRLDRLEAKDAMALMAELAKSNTRLSAATQPERQLLYEVTGGNPLLLRWTIGQLGRGGSKCRTIPEACDYLTNAPSDNDPLEYIFGDLLDTFTDSETAVLAALTHFSEPTSVNWISNLAGLAEGQTRTALEDLADRALLVGNPTGQMFHLPTLAAKFLRDKRPEAVAQTGDRLADRAYALVQENGHQKYERFPLLEAEWGIINTALPRLLQGENKRLQKLCGALQMFSIYSGRWDESFALQSEAEAKALSVSDFESAGWRAIGAGQIAGLRRNAMAMITTVDRALAHWKNANSNSRALAIAMQLRGQAYIIQNKNGEATAALQQSLDLFCAIEPRSPEVTAVLIDLGRAAFGAGDHTTAERHFREASEMATKLGRNGSRATCIGNLAAVAISRRDWKVAAQLGHEALELADQIGRQELIASSCHRLALALTRLGHPDEGLPYARRAVDIAKKLRLPTLPIMESVLKECEQALETKAKPPDHSP